ncbi:MAG: fibronectin type III domain-containing protein [Acidobacteriota bacterium]
MRPRAARRLLLMSLTLVAALSAAIPVAAQFPPPSPWNQASTVFGVNNVRISWWCTQLGNCTTDYFLVEVTRNGNPYPGSPFNVGFPGSASSGFEVTGSGLPEGIYNVHIVAVNAYGQSRSANTMFVISTAAGPPGMPTLYQPTASGSTVTISWAPPTTGGAATDYDIEAIVQATGQVYNVPVGNQTSAVFGGIAPGNFLVRIRARNAAGVSEWTPQRLLVVGVVLGSGALQVTLTWNTTADMDLHVREPNGTHVYFANKIGTSATLDVDDTNGYGPENIYVREGQALAGVYRFYIVHYSGSVATTSTITVRLRPGTAQEVAVLYTRTSTSGNPSVGFLVVDVNVNTGSITEVTGTIAADELPGDLRVKAAALAR